jgi:hypothetical protein
MVSKRGFLAASAAAVFSFTAGIGSATGAGTKVLDLELNEVKANGVVGVAHDSSGYGNDGTIGKRVVVNGSYATFPFVKPNTVSYGLDQLITVPDADTLDPGTSTFTIEMRYRTTHAFGNILQKGQATSPGGQVKLQQPKGKLTCMFKTPTGTATAGSGTKLLDDGQWHDIKCVRTTSAVTLYVDGVRTGRTNHTTGDLNNSKPWSIGGKPSCDGTKVTCDYFAGDVDYVRLTKG